MAGKEGIGVDAVEVNLFDDWPPNFSCVSLASAQSVFELLSGDITPRTASDSLEIIKSHNLWHSSAHHTVVGAQDSIT